MSDRGDRYPTFRDLYEVQESVDKKIDDVKADLSKLKIGFVVLLLAVASPKFGGPSASDVVALVYQHIS